MKVKQFEAFEIYFCEYPVCEIERIAYSLNMVRKRHRPSGVNNISKYKHIIYSVSARTCGRE